MAFTSQSISQARDLADRMRAKMVAIKEEAEAQIGNGILVTEVGATCFAFGYANGRWGEDGEMKMLGVPVDLGVGFALAGVAMFGGLGKYAEHGVNIGAGALAAYGYRSGFQLGVDAADSDTQPSASVKKTSTTKTAAKAMNGGSTVNTGWDGQTYTVHDNAA